MTKKNKEMLHLLISNSCQSYCDSLKTKDWVAVDLINDHVCRFSEYLKANLEKIDQKINDLFVSYKKKVEKERKFNAKSNFDNTVTELILVHVKMFANKLMK